MTEQVTTENRTFASPVTPDRSSLSQEQYNMAENKLEDYNLTYKDVIEILGKTRRTVQRYVEEGKLSPQKRLSESGPRVYFSESEVNKFKEELDRRNGQGGDTRDRTMSRQVVALQTAVMTFQQQLEKKEKQLEAKEKMINELNRELGKLEGQMKDVQKLAEEREKLEAEIDKSQEKHARDILFTNLIYVLLIILGIGALIAFPYIQNLINR